MKIFELKGEHFLKGLSLQDNYPVGGVLQLGVYDPFERMGYAQPALVSSRVGTSEITTDVNVIVPYENSGTPLAYCFSDRNSSGKGVYQVNTSTGVVTDVSSTFHINLGASTEAKVQGAIMHKGWVVYEQDGVMRRNTKTGTTDTNIGSVSAGPLYKRRGVVAAGTLYWPDGYQISTIDDSWTLANSAFVLPTSFRIVSLEFDGDNIAIVCDENSVPSGGVPTSDVIVRCQVRYWNRTSSTATRIWDISEPYVVGSTQLDGITYVFGANGIWYCTINQSPKLLLNYKNVNSTIQARPSSPYQITIANNSIMWTSNVALGTAGYSQQVFAYGSPIPGANKIFYSPYQVHDSSFHQTSLAYCGATLLAGTSSNRVYQLNSGSTRNGVTLQTVSMPMDRPYTYEGVMVNLLSPLSSGESVTVSAHANNSATVISDTNSSSYTNIGAKKHLWIPRTGGSTDLFRDLTLTISADATAIISSIEVYGNPADEKTVF